MRVYPEPDEEKLRLLRLVRDWTGEGFVSEAQQQRMEADCQCELKRTNGFLRVVLFVFTLIAAAAATGLVWIAISQPENAPYFWLFLLIVAPICYAGAEFAVSQSDLYRYGIEEALALLSIIFLFAALAFGLREQGGMMFLAPLAGLLASLGVYYRFGFRYAFVGAVIFAALIPRYWTSSHAGQHVIIAALFGAGLATVIRLRDAHRSDYLHEESSFAEGLLWLGLYIAVNLQLSSLDLLSNLWSMSKQPHEFSGLFYWATYLLIWCLPAGILWCGITRKDRTLIWVGLLAAILTFVTNKPYLGWARHSWDPMLLGILLTGGAVIAQRWLARGAGGVRNGFTAQRLSRRDAHVMNALSGMAGLVTPGPAALPRSVGSDTSFGGGTSGGGGASSDF